MSSATKIYVAVSACLVGEKVRYDGDHRQSSAVQRLGEHFQLLSFCPEILMGMGAPREKIYLQQQNSKWEIIGESTGNNYTSKSGPAVAEIESILMGRKISAFILKAKSPSCGLNNYQPPADNSARDGLIAEQLRLKFPTAAFVDEHLLNDDEAFNDFVQNLKNES
ncbi:MAG: DUF523 domain-containing protein [Planctomycetota bacterium]|jgi:uncharacterized protein YbbK (DUF523 family)|nr:DUF523 domain-containing protein [Planctomycetota bacterium]